MSLDKKVLFSYLRRAPFGGKLSQDQVNGVNVLLDTWAKEYPNPDIRFVAYSMASVFHETGGRMTPVRETFASTDIQAKARLTKAHATGRLPWVSKDYWSDGYFGRGYIQLTHRVNYRRVGLRLGLDLVNNPKLTLKPTVSAQIAIIGMVEGLFTTKKLEHYFNDKTDDPTSARKIVNGTDKAKLIAGYHKSFLAALTKAATSRSDDLQDVDESTYTPDIPDSISWRSILLSGLAAVGVSGEVLDLKGPYYVIPILAVAVALGWYLRNRK